MTLDAVLANATGSPWQSEFQTAIRDPQQLCERLNLPPQVQSAAASAAHHFSVFVPESYLSRMQPGRVDDPLVRQVLPLAEELREIDGFHLDAVGDQSAREQPGLIQKYQGRALLMVTGLCAVHCRYCFRRHYPYGNDPREWADWEPAWAQLQGDESISEVILSGGDPLSVSDGRLARFVERLSRIPQLKRLRVHTRLPIMIPSRVTDALLAILEQTRLRTYVVVHANHVQELDQDVTAALQRLQGAGTVVLNQAVLLRGVNDSVTALYELCASLADLGVLPYYLHQLDRVQGAAHFEVPIDRGRELIAELRRRLPGYAVPQYVQELPGEKHKIVLG